MEVVEEKWKDENKNDVIALSLNCDSQYKISEFIELLKNKK